MEYQELGVEQQGVKSSRSSFGKEQQQVGEVEQQVGEEKQQCVRVYCMSSWG